jgi:phage/plasmid-associated DNA primase
MTAETEDGQRLAESLIKRVTGQDALTVRFPFKEYFSYVPTWKLWFIANHKPVIRGTDFAIWRRIPLIPFTVTILEECCVIQPGTRVSKADLFKAYTQWCQDNHEFTLSHKTFAPRLLKQPGITDSKVGSVRWWVGIGLSATAEQDLGM